MKTKYSLFLSLLALFVLGLSSCKEEPRKGFLENNPNGCMVSYTLPNLTPTTRAVQGTEEGRKVRTEAFNYEKLIQSLYVVAFRGANGEDGLYHLFSLTVPTGSTSGTFDMLQQGAFFLYFVANPSAPLVEKMKTVSTRRQFEQLLCEQESGGGNHFLMVNTEPVTVTTVKGKTTPVSNGGKVVLTRASVRYDVYEPIKGFSITKVYLKNKPINTRLLASTSTTDLTILASDESKAVAVNSNFAVGKLYSYEHPEGGKVTLVVEATYKGKDITPVEIIVGKEPIKRNHIYAIKLTDKNSGTPSDKEHEFDADITVIDWNEGAELGLTEEEILNYRPKLAIEYVAEYNLAQDGTFTNSHKNDASGYFDWDTATSMKYPEGYHLPSFKEFSGVFPGTLLNRSFFRTEQRKHLNIEEEVDINGERKTYTADYLTTTGDKIYAIKQKGNGDRQKVAVCYQLVGDFKKEGNLDSHLVVRVRYIGSEEDPLNVYSDVTIDDLPGLFKRPDSSEIIRIFPACGYTSGEERGLRASFFTSTSSTVAVCQNSCFVSPPIFCFD